MKKARKWLDAQGLEYEFHNFKKAGLDKASLLHWIDQAGWETRRSIEDQHERGDGRQVETGRIVLEVIEGFDEKVFFFINIAGSNHNIFNIHFLKKLCVSLPWKNWMEGTT